jgi:predicted N-acetyltransferase YhbS
MIGIRNERAPDIAAREALLDLSFGPGRAAKTSERLREGRLPAEGLSFTATDHGRLVGTLRLWHVSSGPERPALLLGPLAVDPDCRDRGIGSALMEQAISDAREIGHQEIILVGDEPYYSRFGFSAARTAGLSLPGPFEPHRLLGLALAQDAVGGPAGVMYPAGVLRPAGLPAPAVALHSQWAQHIYMPRTARRALRRAA